MTAAVLGVGAKLYRTDVSPWDFIAEITTLSGPSVEAAEIDVTNLDSTGVERIQGLSDGGNVEFEANWIRDTEQINFRDSITTRTTHTYQIQWPTSPLTTASFTGLPLSFSMNAEPGGAVTSSFSMRVSGAITWA